MCLSIFVFISTLFWPQLLDKQSLLIALASSFILLFIPRLRYLAVIPISALYFTLYANLTLTGQLFPSTQRGQEDNLAVLVDGQDHTIIVRIVSLISENNRGYFNAKLVQFDTDHFTNQPLIEMRWYKPKVTVQAGQLHRFVVRFKPVYGRANPAGVDRQKWSYSQHIGFQATIKNHINVINEKNTLRADFYQQVKEFTEKLKHQGIILALSFADKSLMPLAVKEQIRNLGISHLFAISGLHIGLLFSFVFIVVQYFANALLPHNKMGWFSLRLINVSALIGAFGYAYLAGFSLPTTRALLMLLVSVFVLTLKRQCSKVDLLLLVLFVVLIADPLAVMSVSLWLSFSAVAVILALLWAFPMLCRPDVGQMKMSLGRKVGHYIKLLLFLQIGLTLLLLPVQIFAFSGLSLCAIVINIIAIPLFSLLLIPFVLIAAGMTLCCPDIALFLFILCDQLLTYFFELFQFLGESYYYFSDFQSTGLLVLLALFFLLFIMYFQFTRQRHCSYLLAFFIFFMLLLEYSKAPSKESWFVDIIDVGQGLSVLVRHADEVLLYDTGARYPSGFNMADHEIAPYLISLGIHQLDYLVISHSDIDHAGGVERVLDSFTVLNRFSGEPLQSASAFTQCEPGQTWSLGTLTVVVLAPIRVTKNNNNNSCVLRISDGKKSLLLTGDIEKKQEKILINQSADKLHSDILLAPHHGSRHSSSVDFINAVSPQWVVFSAGFMNHWGFPADEVVTRYQQQSVNMVNSGQSGLIRFQITTQTIKMQTFREDLAPYWYHHSLTP